MPRRTSTFPLSQEKCAEEAPRPTLTLSRLGGGGGGGGRGGCILSEEITSQPDLSTRKKRSGRQTNASSKALSGSFAGLPGLQSSLSSSSTIPIPSFQVERQTLAAIFSEDEEEDHDIPSRNKEKRGHRIDSSSNCGTNASTNHHHRIHNNTHNDPKEHHTSVGVCRKLPIPSFRQSPSGINSDPNRNLKTTRRNDRDPTDDGHVACDPYRFVHRNDLDDDDDDDLELATILGKSICTMGLVKSGTQKDTGAKEDGKDGSNQFPHTIEGSSSTEECNRNVQECTHANISRPDRMTMTTTTTTTTTNKSVETAATRTATTDLPPVERMGHSSDDIQVGAPLPSWTREGILSCAIEKANHFTLKNIEWDAIWTHLDEQYPIMERPWCSIISKQDVKRCILEQSIAPSDEMLIPVVDSIFSRIDRQSATVKQVTSLVQEHFAVPFSLACRKKIRQRLSDLMNRKCHPSTSSDIPATINATTTTTTTISTVDTANIPESMSRGHLESPALENDENCRSVLGIKGDETSQRTNGNSQSRQALPNRKRTRGAASSNGPMIHTKTTPGISSNMHPGVLSGNEIYEHHLISVQCVPVDSVQHSSPVKVANDFLDVIDVENLELKGQDSKLPLKKKSMTDDIRLGTKRRGSRKATASTANHGGTDTLDRPETGTTRRRQNQSCHLCKNCPCKFAQTHAGSLASVLDLPQSDTAIEKALLRRLQNMEKTADHYDSQTEAVRRALKKHRREMWRKRTKATPAQTLRLASRFLPDAEELTETVDGIQPAAPLSAHRVSNAVRKVFSRTPAHQPTLTQMFGLGTTPTESKDQPHVDLTSEWLEKHSESINEIEVVDDDVDSAREDTIATENVDYELLPSGAFPCSRISYNNGSEQVDMLGSVQECRSVWMSMLTQNYKSAWEIFLEERCQGESDVDVDDVDGSVVDNLIGLFMNERIEMEAQSWEHHDCVDDSFLSQRAKITGERIMKKISNDVQSVSALRLECPRWKENVVYALSHNDTTQLQQARGEVRGARNKLEEVKLAMLNIIERKAKVLDFFEYVISESEGRFQVDDECQTQGFLPTQFVSSPVAGRRESLVSEAETPAGEWYNCNAT